MKRQAMPAVLPMAIKTSRFLNASGNTCTLALYTIPITYLLNTYPCSQPEGTSNRTKCAGSKPDLSIFVTYILFL
jgi:hypothetical protein